MVCTQLAEDWISTQSKGLWDSQMKGDMEMLSIILLLHVINTSASSIRTIHSTVDAHLRGKYFGFMNINGCSQYAG